MGKTRRWFRWLCWTAVVLACLGGLAWAGVFLATEREMVVPPLLTAAPVRLPAGDVAEGERLARVLGCRGCHGPDLGGRVFVEIPHVVRLVAPNLTQVRARYDDRAFVRLMRSGAKADGRAKQQDKMKSCNKEAGDKALKGDERKKFMSECLKG